MSEPQSIELTAAQAASLVQDELQAAALAFQAAELDAACDASVRALGLALQLGPAAAENVLRTILDGARDMARREDATGLATLGPALAGLVDQVRAAGALPANPIMEAWAAVGSEVGAMLGQWGIALSLPAEQRHGLLGQLRARAALLDAATNSLFRLASWPDDRPSP